MTTNPYISLNNINYLTSPYADGVNNLTRAFSSSSTNRFSHLTAGVALLIPVVNLVVYVALKQFATISAPASKSSKPAEKPAPRPTHHHRHTHRSSRNKKPQPAPAQRSVFSSMEKTRQAFHGAGILPYRFNNGQLELLIGKESGGYHPNTWSDFGGKPERGENPIQTAAREGTEETGKILGSQSTLERRLKTAPHIGSRYVMYLLRMDDPKVTPEAFKRARHDGEKSAIAWVKAHDVFRAVSGNGMLAIGNHLEKLRNPFINTLRLSRATQVFAQIQGSGQHRRSA